MGKGLGPEIGKPKKSEAPPSQANGVFKTTTNMPQDCSTLYSYKLWNCYQPHVLEKGTRYYFLDLKFSMFDRTFSPLFLE